MSQNYSQNINSGKKMVSENSMDHCIINFIFSCRFVSHVEIYRLEKAC